MLAQTHQSQNPHRAACTGIGQVGQERLKAALADRSSSKDKNPHVLETQVFNLWLEITPLKFNSSPLNNGGKGRLLPIRKVTWKFRRITGKVYVYGCFLKWYSTPISHPKCWSFLVGKPMGLLGKPTILGNPHIDTLHLLGMFYTTCTNQPPPNFDYQAQDA